jgi:hypothetical protein
MEKNISTFNSIKKKKPKPYIHWDKETDEWTCKAIIETEIIDIEPTTADEYNEALLESSIHKHTNNEVDMDTLDSISRITAHLISFTKDKPLYSEYELKNGIISRDLKLVDKWLTNQYKKQSQKLRNGAINDKNRKETTCPVDQKQKVIALKEK